MAEETSLEKRNETAEIETAETEETTDEVEQIREQIEETRAEMSETIDAIQEKLSLSNITEQVSEQISEQATAVYQAAKETVYSATIGKAGEIFGVLSEAGKKMKKTKYYNQVASNPFPFVLIGLGVGMLLFGGKSKSYASGDRRNFAGGGSRMKNVTGKIGDAASSAYDTVGDAADSVYKGVRRFADDTMERAGQLGTTAQEKYEYYIEEKPLAIGAVALALGAAVGLSVPSTRYENQLMGETRANLMAKAGDAVQETIKKVENVAGQVVETVSTEAKNQDLV
jgi:ElaB/YqjD/DUF883 family membrane-anchored ribosome-binding protein